jgi:hypothetical protein
MNTLNQQPRGCNTRIKYPTIWRRLRYRRLVVGRWPRQREIIVATIKSVILSGGV